MVVLADSVKSLDGAFFTFRNSEMVHALEDLQRISAIFIFSEWLFLTHVL
jgi:hypothetical protein